jgi:hypothetical protein
MFEQALLIPVADWLHEALATCPETNDDTLTTNLKVSDHLVDLVAKHEGHGNSRSLPSTKLRQAEHTLMIMLVGLDWRC